MNNQYGPETGYRPPQVSYPYDSGNAYNTPQTMQNGLDPRGQAGMQPMNGQNAAGIPPYPYMQQGMPQNAAPTGQTGSYIPQTPYSAGYGQPYAQPQQNRQMYEQQPAYTQAGQMQGYQQTGYQQTGYQQTPYPQNAYQQPDQSRMPYPQNPYFAQNAQPQGYTQTPYAQPNQTPQGYDPLGQMGRQQNRAGQNANGYNFRTARQIPLNGGGYVPDQKPLRKKPFVFDAMKLSILCGVLAVLFAAGMLTGIAVFKWIYIALAAGSIVLFWVKPLITGNSRLCYSAVFGVLALVALVSLLAPGKATEDRVTPDGGAQGVQTQYAGGQVTSAPGGNDNVVVVNGTSITPTPPPENNEQEINEEAIAQLQSFFYFWSANKLDEMLALTMPSWQSMQENAKNELFHNLQNRTPLDYRVDSITGTKDDMSRTVTVTSTIGRNNNKDPGVYRMSIIMTRENNTWYVDPRSLKTYEEAGTPTPSPTPGPTPAPEAAPSTVLYYNPSGGTKYHADQNCRNIHSKYLPLQGKFTYSQINDAPYDKLQPCNVCAAPLR